MIQLTCYYYYFLPSVSMFPREFKNWKYEMQVGTMLNLFDQRPADSRAAKWRWNAAPKLKLVEKRKLSSLASPEMLVILLPRSFRRKRAEELRTPRVSTAIGSKTKRLSMFIVYCLFIVYIFYYYCYYYYYYYYRKKSFRWRNVKRLQGHLTNAKNGDKTRVRFKNVNRLSVRCSRKQSCRDQKSFGQTVLSSTDA